MNELFVTHRLIGKKVADLPTDESGNERVLLQNGPYLNQIEMALTCMLMPATDDDVARWLVDELAQIIERTRYLGIPDSAIKSAVDKALQAHQEAE